MTAVYDLLLRLREASWQPTQSLRGGTMYQDIGERVLKLADAERIVRESWPAATTAQPSGDPADDYAKATATRKVIGRMVPDAARECVYTEDGDGVWKCSACGFLLSLSDGSPDDNKYAYCPHCGARISESRAYVEDDDDTE